MDSIVEKGMIKDFPMHKDEQELLKLKSGLERVEAKIEGIFETKKISDERFSRISEEIGELRSMLIDREREIKELEGKATRAHDLVQEVQPELLKDSIDKQDLKIDAIKNKIDSNDSIMNKIIEELKDIRNKIELFRGVEETIKLNKNVREELINIRKIEQNIKIHADKVENIFIRLEKKFEDFESYKKDAEKLSDDFKKFAEEFTKIKGNTEKYVSKEDLHNLKYYT